MYPPGKFVRADSKRLSGGVCVRADSKGVSGGTCRANAHTWGDRAETKGVRTNHGSVGDGGLAKDWVAVAVLLLRVHGA